MPMQLRRRAAERRGQYQPHKLLHDVLADPSGVDREERAPKGRQNYTDYTQQYSTLAENAYFAD
jgi:hypothetical protein